MEINPFVVEIDLISIAILLMVRYGITERASRLREVHVFRYLVDLSIAFCVLNSTGQFIPSTYIPVIKIINGLKIVTCICMGCSWFLTVFFIISSMKRNCCLWDYAKSFSVILTAVFSGLLCLMDFGALPAS